VARHPAGSILHRAEWQAVYGVYRLPVLRLAAEREGNIVGILPLVWQKSVLFGNQLVSLPWFDAVNVLADDRSAWESLVSAARRSARDRGNAVLQLRQTEPADLDCHVRTDKVLMRLKLEADPEALWKRLSAKVRNQVRKGEKSALAVESGGSELLDDFYDVYSENMRDLGSPSHHRRLFSAVCGQFAESCRVHVVRRRGQAVGAGLTIANGGRLEIPWASSLREFGSLCVNHLMYWTILAGGCREGFEWFHFGRSSRDSGTYHFKKQWGAEEIPLYWYLLDGRGKPKTAVSAPQESFGWATKVWQKLPLPLARRLGPHIIARVP
jgi:FemAB-related protein (PEP-CTERM system-associated)